MNQPTLETDVFISYAHADRPFARQLAEALRAHELVVWWDRHLATGSEFAHEIETQLLTAKVVLGLWSAQSVRSGFVRDECSRALNAGKFLPVRIEDVALPLGFGQVHTLNLVDWEGDHDDENFAQLVSEIHQRKGQAPTPLPAHAPAGRIWRRRNLRRLAPLLLAAALVGGGGWWAWQQFQRREADAHFLSGLERQGGREPDLVRAFSEYLIALQHNPKHGLALYYLANIYVLRGQPEEALAAFQGSLRENRPPLEATLRREAEKQVKALSGDAREAVALDRSRPAPSPSSAPPLSTSPSTSPSPSLPSAQPAPVPQFPPPPQTRPPQLKAEAQRASASRLPPRIEPPADQRAALARRVDTMFGADKDQRIAATTGLIVEPPALSDAAPLALEKALATLRRHLPLDTAASSGIVNTLVLLQSALPGTLQAQREPIEALLAATQSMGDTTRAQAAKLAALLQASNEKKPVAFLQIANEQQRPIAEALAERFRMFGYEVPGIELAGNRAPERTELRVQGRSERGFARWLARAVDEIAGVEAGVQTLRSAKPGGDTYEVWLGRDLCAAEMVPGCAGTAR